MPGQRCAVAVCDSNFTESKKRGLNISFYQFPRNERLCKLWIIACRRKDSWNPATSRVCSLHFKEQDFERNLRAELMKLPFRRILKAGAVPSLRLGADVAVAGASSARDHRMQRKESKRLVEELLETEGKEVEKLMDITNITTSHRESDLEILQCKNETLLQENKTLKEQLMKNTSKMKCLQKKIDSLENQLISVKKTAEESTTVEHKIREALSSVLTKKQLEVILDSKKRVVWGAKDISNAFAIRYFSVRCYKFLRENLKYPLPGISSLQRWGSNINMRQGILHDILAVMEVAGHEKTEFHRITVLQFDEIKVASVYEYDQQSDEIVGPHSQMQCVMARGLFDKWKQPIYINFDQKMTKDILDSIIMNLSKVHYSVVACVSDCGGGNLGLWRELGISIERTYYEHPVTKEAVFFFADAPHLLKLIRNWLLDTGFILEDGTRVNSTPLFELVKLTDTEISSCHKLTTKHITCQKIERQNVSLAAQLLSHTTAIALKQYISGGNKQMALNTAAFIEIVNKWFDIMNSYSPAENLPSKKPYGMLLPEQREVLNQTIHLFQTLRCTSKNTLLPFQKGVIIACKSLMMLYDNMHSKFNASYLLTHRLNQDSLENHFSQIRTRGGLHDHPSPLNAIYRIRMIILGKNPGIVQNHTNSVDKSHDEYVVATAFKKARILHINVPGAESKDAEVMDDDDSDDNTTYTDTAQQSTVSEEDGLAYMAGYIAKKFREKYPSIGDYTCKQINTPFSAVPSWLQHLSYGGLTEPSEEWTMQVKKMERRFVKFHGENSIRKGKWINKRTQNFILKKLPDIPKDLVAAFAKLRIFARIRFLNLKKRDLVRKKRKTHNKYSKLV